jgi:hypothetical protein
MCNIMNCSSSEEISVGLEGLQSREDFSRSTPSWERGSVVAFSLS